MQICRSCRTEINISHECLLHTSISFHDEQYDDLSVYPFIRLSVHVNAGCSSSCSSSAGFMYGFSWCVSLVSLQASLVRWSSSFHHVTFSESSPFLTERSRRRREKASEEAGFKWKSHCYSSQPVRRGTAASHRWSERVWCLWPFKKEPVWRALTAADVMLLLAKKNQKKTYKVRDIQPPVNRVTQITVQRCHQNTRGFSL